MKLFILGLVLVVLAAAAIRYWLAGVDETVPTAVSGVSTPSIKASDAIDIERSFDSSTKAFANTGKEHREIPVFQMTSYRDFRDLVEFAGFDPDKYVEDTAIWLTNRGVNYQFLGVPNEASPVQPYAQYDEDTLIGLAGNGDVWAQRLVGERWLRRRPAEAVGMLQLAAEQGSTVAMSQLALFYNGNFGLNDPENTGPGDNAEQERVILEATPDLELESARWQGAAQIFSGGGMPGPDNPWFGSNKQLTAERRLEFCEAALQTYRDLQQARAASGLPPFEITASPFPQRPENGGYCDLPDWPRPDFSRCRYISAIDEGGDKPHMLRICPPGESD